MSDSQNQQPTPPTGDVPGISKRRVLQGGAIVAIGLMAAQGSGFLRQVALGYLLGTGPGADALTAAMAPVELWWSVLSITVVFGFVPKLTAGGPQGGYGFRDILSPVMRFSVGSSIAMLIFAKPIVLLIAPGMDAETTDLAAGLSRLMALSPAAVGVTFAYSALLYSRRHFLLASVHHAVVNVTTIAGALLLIEPFGVYGFAIGYAFGSWLQLLVAHFYCKRKLPDAFEEPPGGARKLDVWTLLTGPGPIVGQALAMELNTAVSRAYASTFGLGMTAAFDYAFKLFRVPMALLVVPLSQGLLPEVAAANNRASAVRAMKRFAVLLIGCGAAAMVVMILWGDPLIALLFERGRFGRESTDAVAAILLSYMPVILGRGVLDLLSRTLFGMGVYRSPLFAALLALAINAALCAVLPNDNPSLIGLGAILGFWTGAYIIVSRVWKMGREETTQPS